MPQKLEVAEGGLALCAALVDVAEDSGRARAIERIRIPYNQEN